MRHGRQRHDRSLLHDRVIDEGLEHRRRSLVAGADERLERLLTVTSRGIAVGEDATQLGENARIAEPDGHHSGKPPDRLVGVGGDRLVALLPGLRGLHPPAGRQRRHDLLEHPLPRRRIGRRQPGHEGFVAAFLGGSPTDDEPRHRRDLRRCRQR